MEKLDAIVAAAGAVILVVAIVGAAVSGGPGAEFDVTHALVETALEGGSTAHTGEAVADTYTFTVNGTNLVALRVTATLAFTGAPSGAVHATLTAPNGTAYEQDASAGGPQGAAQVAFDVPLGSAPEDRTVSSESAESALPPDVPAGEAAGEWTLVLQGASGQPVPFASATTSWSGVLVSWQASSTLSPPGSR